MFHYFDRLGPCVPEVVDTFNSVQEFFWFFNNYVLTLGWIGHRTVEYMGIVVCALRAGPIANTKSTSGVELYMPSMLSTRMANLIMMTPFS